jgi:ribosomal subunit interface protein
MMNISIQGIKMSLTEAIKDAVYRKLESLEKFIQHPAHVSVELGKPSAHHKAGPDVFLTEITIDTNGQTYFVKSTHSDLYAALDLATSEMSEVIKQGKGKRQTLVRKGRMMIKNLIRKNL